ncbi:MAG: hypothetical protein A2X94_13565 [Bdellovibrionales bacterium GWB1_55_8]|nr:MAG: hypothetical protein A2X94_13565 [Bdellovibrionales bacterium GWB1_55_8]
MITLRWCFVLAACMCVALISFGTTTKASTVKQRIFKLRTCDPKSAPDNAVKAALEAAINEAEKLPPGELPERGKVPVRMKEYRCEVRREKDGSFEIVFHNKESEAWMAREKKAGREYLGGAGVIRAAVKEGKVLDIGFFQ